GPRPPRLAGRSGGYRPPGQPPAADRLVKRVRPRASRPPAAVQPHRSEVPVYFCDPACPWQRGSDENTNDLLRQYFPKGTDLSTHGPEQLETVAAELNSRPRKTLDWETPAERLHKLLAA
ncbi:IS30 family transposase, partial [Streptomyces lydicus]|uniref:IS30 family transposase n=1 Tax=Streptomyces lydicus TaxID=47763 RepID=UPI0033304A58